MVVEAPYNYKSTVFVKLVPLPAYAVAVTVPLTSSAVVGDTLLIESLLLLLSQKKVLVDAILVPLPYTTYPAGYAIVNAFPLLRRVPVKLISPTTSTVYAGVVVILTARRFVASSHLKLLKLVNPSLPVPIKIYVTGSVGRSNISVILHALAIKRLLMLSYAIS